jgi:hypothetical protein
MPRLLLAAPFLLVLHAAAQAREDSRPSLFFREDWKEIAAVAPVTQELTLKLANGMWLVSDYAEGPTVDWHESGFAIAGIRWRRMNIDLQRRCEAVVRAYPVSTNTESRLGSARPGGQSMRGTSAERPHRRAAGMTSRIAATTRSGSSSGM